MFMRLTSISLDSRTCRISVISWVLLSSFSTSKLPSSEPTLISLSSRECPRVFSVLCNNSVPLVECKFAGLWRDCVELESPFGLMKKKTAELDAIALGTFRRFCFCFLCSECRSIIRINELGLIFCHIFSIVLPIPGYYFNVTRCRCFQLVPTGVTTRLIRADLHQIRTTVKEKWKLSILQFTLRFYKFSLP